MERKGIELAKAEIAFRIIRLFGGILITSLLNPCPPAWATLGCKQSRVVTNAALATVERLKIFICPF